MRIKLSGLESRLFRIVLWLTIAICCVDVYWAVRTKEILPEVELNPIGNFLISIGGVELFVSLKMFGTFCFFEISKLLYLWKKKIAWASIGIVFVLHVVLLFFFVFRS